MPSAALVWAETHGPEPRAPFCVPRPDLPER